MKITIKHNRKLYELYGVKSVQPMATDENGLCIFFESELPSGFTIGFVFPAKIVSAYTTSLGMDVNDEKTYTKLGIL